MVDPDGQELAVVAQGDGVEFYYGRQRMRTFCVTPRAAMRISVFLLWWWIGACWCGVRARLWGWAMGTSLKGDG